MKTFNPIDPFDEEDWEYVSSITFYDWLKDNYPKNMWRRIEEINCSDQHISSLEGVDILQNLKKFNCSGNKLRRFTEISNCKKLQYLNIDNNEIDNVAPIVHMSSLREFSCRGNLFTETVKKNIIGYCKSVSNIKIRI